MVIFVCHNKDCERVGTEVLMGQVTYILVEDKLVAKERFCPICKKEMEELPQERKSFGFLIKEEFGSPDKNWNRPVKNPLY